MKKLVEKTKNAVPGFQTFWDAYGLKRDRVAAERAWKRLSAKDKKLAIKGIDAYRESCQRSGIAMMYGQGYLNHRRWEDDMSDAAVEKHSTVHADSNEPQGDLTRSVRENMKIW